MLKVEFQVRNVVFVLMDLSIGGIGENYFESLAVLVASLHVLRAVGVGGVHDVEVDAVPPARPLAVIAKVSDEKILTTKGVERALDIVLEAGEVTKECPAVQGDKTENTENLEDDCDRLHF